MVKFLKSTLAGVQGALGNVPLPSLPRLGREVAIPVYLVHNSDKVEDYFFIFDFEEFVERSREGIFVRPVLKVWSGRDDFDRVAFARQFRESFAQEFEAARAALSAGAGRDRGWFGWLSGTGKEMLGGGLSSFVSNIVLLVALSAGRMVLARLLPTGFLEGRSDERKLEDNIEATKNKVDEALSRLALVLHRDLTLHAFYGSIPEHLADATFEEWPLPGFVARHLDLD